MLRFLLLLRLLRLLMAFGIPFRRVDHGHRLIAVRDSMGIVLVHGAWQTVSPLTLSVSHTLPSFKRLSSVRLESRGGSYPRSHAAELVVCTV